MLCYVISFLNYNGPIASEASNERELQGLGTHRRHPQAATRCNQTPFATTSTHANVPTASATEVSAAAARGDEWQAVQRKLFLMYIIFLIFIVSFYCCVFLFILMQTLIFSKMSRGSAGAARCTRRRARAPSCRPP